MSADDLPVPEITAPEPERESAIEAILADTKTAMTGEEPLYGQDTPRQGKIN